MKNKSIIFLSSALMVSVNLCAAPVRVIAGKSINVNVDFSSDGNSSKCNAVINIPNQEQINFELTPPTFKTSIPIILNSLGIYDITWEGKVKFQGLGTLFGCKGRGLATVNVVAFNNAETKERWKRYFESVGPSYADCIKNELNLRQVKFESGDLTDELIGPTEIDMLPIYSYCKKTKDAEERDRANEYAAQTANRAAKLAADLAEKDRIKQLEKEEEVQNAKRMEAEKAKIAAEKEKAYRESPEGKKKLAEEEAQRLKAKEEELKKYEQEKARIAKDFPYIMSMKCGVNGQFIDPFQCFVSEPKTDLELRNGKDYGLYNFQSILNSNNIPNARSLRQELQIDLRDNFEVTAQNSHKYFHLRIEIRKRSNNEIIWQKEVSQFGVIKVRN